MVLYPVILPVPPDIQKLTGRSRLRKLQAVAREALEMSVRESGLRLEKRLKDELGAPIPYQGTFWSVSHKPKFAAAVVSRERVGIDVEEIVPRRNWSLFSYLASEQEWELVAGELSWHNFYRYFTAKEAVLKAAGVGLRGLSSCRVVEVPDDRHIIIDYCGLRSEIEQVYHENHVFSVTRSEEKVVWMMAAYKLNTDIPSSASKLLSLNRGRPTTLK